MSGECESCGEHAVDCECACHHKKSTHYFMCHMTQEEWEELNKNHDVVEYQFNKMNRT